MRNNQVHLTLRGKLQLSLRMDLTYQNKEHCLQPSSTQPNHDDEVKQEEATGPLLSIFKGPRQQTLHFDSPQQLALLLNPDAIKKVLKKSLYGQVTSPKLTVCETSTKRNAHSGL